MGRYEKYLVFSRRAYLFIVFLLFISLKLIAVNCSDPNVQVAPSNINPATESIQQPIIIDKNWSETAIQYDWCTRASQPDESYIIHDLTIQVGSNDTGLIIRNSAIPFNVVNCTISMAVSHVENSFARGIVLDNVTRGVLNNLTIMNLNVGMTLINSSLIEVLSCSFQAGHIGIYMSNTNYSVVHGNNVRAFNLGFYIAGSCHNSVSNNIFDQDAMPISIVSSHENTINENNFFNSNDFCITMIQSNFNEVKRNRMVGFLIDATRESRCFGNQIEDNEKIKDPMDKFYIWTLIL
ncbi:MAG: NosD domain-containing protein, partial [Promethearchaeota archaeon]